jgi:hypothetical protein
LGVGGGGAEAASTTSATIFRASSTIVVSKEYVSTDTSTPFKRYDALFMKEPRLRQKKKEQTDENKKNMI